ncbi:hypothetical protein BDV93DRAFT_505825 [Ceratobasidium sp. AG-I]|nr:hypothetical protein BDV93DRAFT_505825 [Ceratobasidium sp. AG-I]
MSPSSSLKDNDDRNKASVNTDLTPSAYDYISPWDLIQGKPVHKEGAATPSTRTHPNSDWILSATKNIAFEQVGYKSLFQAASRQENAAFVTLTEHTEFQHFLRTHKPPQRSNKSVHTARPGEEVLILNEASVSQHFLVHVLTPLIEFWNDIMVQEDKPTSEKSGFFIKSRVLI